MASARLDMANRTFPGSTKIAVAIALAGFFMALAIYLRPVANRYDLRQGIWIDTATWTAIRCDQQGNCVSYDRRGARERFAR